tara:strand:- start:11 stop:196 length:186 start_codon:yes stop_codon:yes gene_type:complete
MGVKYDKLVLKGLIAEYENKCAELREKGRRLQIEQALIEDTLVYLNRSLAACMSKELSGGR